ncbi:maltose phosphorylase [Clostridium zeae]|uniref:Maltose phosphorylase n=1 Tax=Clostridium zeae TaxID=2759022 RepID=A0ABQ1E8T0_9CLOT|nr:family 65 glycosyl hydrolase domain-containing protein [Clostridium zeae]GFZ31136.1 maltose phosphorylase [Clostridium zeae]
MRNYILHDQWKIIEQGFHPEENRIYESFMSLGNGYMGMRGNFEEDFTGDSLQGSYIAGVYYPDKTRVGWWKNGYPEYFAKVLNSVNYIGIRVKLNGETLDIGKLKDVKDFYRTLNMRDGVLERSFVAVSNDGKETKIEVKRFISLNDKEVAAISYSVTPLNYEGNIEFTPFLDGNIVNEDSNYDEVFWNEISQKSDAFYGDVTMQTKKTNYYVTAAMSYEIFVDNSKVTVSPEVSEKSKYVENTISVNVNKNSTATLYKYIGVTSNRYYEEEIVIAKAYDAVERAKTAGFEKLLAEHSEKWHNHWNESDIVIKGDVAAQQGIRFNIFHMTATYTGEDSRLNIGPKGFTGEKYGGSTYWDTEAYCIPFYLSTADEKIARQLLIYRYNQLDKAKENAAKLGLKGALYPMVTMTGEECHNEWEITFEEIHRNAAITYGIFNYVRYTGDKKYLAEYGFDVIVETARFWVSRSNYVPQKDKYMILGVTGPNEYENNVNNNWYTNTMAAWNIGYALETYDFLKEQYPAEHKALVEKLGITDAELSKMKEVAEKMYYPMIEELGVFAQQDNYMDKEQILVKDLDPSNLPLNQKWSWDRILRSCFIKQADVLQGIFFLNDRYDLETKKKNFAFYEPRTVHESSLSPCVHSIIAAEIGDYDKTYEMYLRTSRLDLDNYNNDTDDGLHITSMAGTWMSIIYGFGGMKVKDDMLHFSPFIPEVWNEYSFKIMFRGNLLNITVNKDNVIINHEKGSNVTIKVFDKEYELNGSTVTV